LTQPSWPDPTVGAQFVRHFGGIRRRGKGGVPELGEAKLCEARRALQFVALPYRNGAPETTRIRCASRHFWFDGFGSGKYELLLVTDAGYSCPDAESTRSLFKRVLATRLRAEGTPNGVGIASGSAPLAARYLRSTTKQSAAAPQDWWVAGGAALMLLELRSDERLALSALHARQGPDTEKLGFRVSKCYLPLRNKELPVWIFELRDGADAVTARSLRIALVRLHAAYESLRLVSAALNSRRFTLKPRGPESQAFQQYLDVTLKLIYSSEKQVQRLADADHALEMAREAFASTDAGALEDTIGLLQQADVRPYYTKALAKLRDDISKAGTVVYGDLVEGDTYVNEGQAGVMGPGAHVNTVTQTGGPAPSGAAGPAPQNT
jgi:hypothetical protein